MEVGLGESTASWASHLRIRRLKQEEERMQSDSTHGVEAVENINLACATCPNEANTMGPLRSEFPPLRLYPPCSYIYAGCDSFPDCETTSCFGKYCGLGLTTLYLSG
jgi:hypothetical protein